MTDLDLDATADAIKERVDWLVAEMDRRRQQQQTAAVWVDPGRRSGEPCLYGTRIPVDTIVRCTWARGAEFTMANWLVTASQVFGACWYVAVHGKRKWRKRWGPWAAEHSGSLWSGNLDNVPWPPRAALGENPDL
jgi:uncharacterized protein (DUF433 family)